MAQPTVAESPSDAFAADATDPPEPRPYTGDIEIRIHGVSGTPPEELLGRADVQRVAGDRVSGFYRPSLPEQMRDGPAGDTGVPGAPPGPWLEGYSWGGWTSGARSRALWLMLMPFALVNVASRMLPPDRPRARWCRLGAASLIRLLALSMTVTLVQGVATVSMVTVAMRCGAPTGTASACHGLPSWLTGYLGALPLAGRVLLCAAVPLLVVALLWWVGWKVSQRYEDAPEHSAPGRPDDAPQPLLRADLWRSGAAISRLRLLHVQAGSVSVAGMAGWLLPGGAARAVTLWLTAATFVTVAVLAWLRPAAPYTADQRHRIMLPARLVWAGVAMVVAALAWQVVPALAHGGGSAGAVPRDVADAATRRADLLWLYLFMGQGALLGLVLLLVAAGLALRLLLLVVALLLVAAALAWRLLRVEAVLSWQVLLPLALILCGLAVAARLARTGRGGRVFVNGFVGPSVAMLGWLIGTMLTDAVLILVPAWLARPGFAFTPWQIATALDGPTTSGWFGDTTRSAGVGTAVGVAVVLLLVIQLGVRAKVARWFGWGARRDLRAVRAAYPGRAGSSGGNDRARRKAIMMDFWWARRVDRVPRAMSVLCALLAEFLVVQLVAKPWSAEQGGWAAFVLGRIPSSCGAGPEGALCAHAGVVAWGVFLTAGLAVVVVAAGVLAYRTATMRRGVGVLWDLACFWPRDTHPFAPPCYNERIMPQVSKRVAWYLGAEGSPAGAGTGPDGARPGRVVLAGHSQGTVIALAAVLAQPAVVRERLSLVTVGCVLDRLYSRFYPRYFGLEVYRTAATMLGGRWINIWRHSDFLGGSVPHPPGDVATGMPGLPTNVESTDPVFAPPPGDTIEPRARRHSDFWTDQTFRPAVRHLLARDRAE